MRYNLIRIASRAGKCLTLSIVVWQAALLCAAEPASVPSRPPVVLTDAAKRLHAETLVIDGHNDLPWVLRKYADSQLDKVDLRQPYPKFHTDLPRLRHGGVGAQFFSAFVPSRTMRTRDSLQMTLEQVDLIHRLVEHYDEAFELALTADDAVRIHAAGKIAAMIGLEGGHSIEDSLGNLQRLYDRGARYMTLTHTDSLAWADSATDAAKSAGLTPFGVEVVREMNRLGMLVDISHVSAETMHDVLDVAAAPVIASHSSAFALAPHPRNVPDEVLRRLAQNGGVVMVNFFSGYLVKEHAAALAGLSTKRRELEAQLGVEAADAKIEEEWNEIEARMPAGSVHDLVDHIEHIARTAGHDHVGLGSDYDGVTTLPAQLEDVSGYPYITQELLNRGWSAENIRKALGENVLRVWRAAEKQAAPR